jgi:hypothetical protein
LEDEDGDILEIEIIKTNDTSMERIYARLGSAMV